MTRGRALFASISILVVFAVGSGTLARAVARERSNEDSLYKSLSIFTEVLNLVRRAYVDETSVDRLFTGALDGTTDALDSMATFVPSESIETYRRTREIGNARSGLAVVKERGVAYVLSVAAGSPAAELGIERGDALAQIDGRSTRAMPLWEIQTLLAGEPGGVLELEVIRRGQSQDESLTLGSFVAPEPAITFEEETPILRISALDERSAGGVERLLSGLVADLKGELLVDLRGVAGGRSAAAYEVADLFVSGPMGELKSRSKTLESFAGERPPVWQGALVVLVDRGTQGASEVLASVLAQSAGAELVGERTFGHAGRQTGVPLSTGGELFLTDAFYTGPDSEPIHSSLVPELIVSEASRNLSEAGVPMSELILRRGLERLRAARVELEKVA